MVNYDLLINQAKKLFEDGKYNESNVIYEKLLLLKEDWYLYFEIGKNYFCLENHKKSEENLLKYLNSVKEHKDLYYYALLLLIKSYKCNGDLKKALNLFKNIKFDKVPHKYVENLLKEKANILFILYERVPKIFDDSKFKELKNKYKEQLKQNKKNYTAIVNLAELYLIKREYDKVVEVAKENIDSIPEEEIYFRNKLINFLETAQGKSDIKAKPLRLTINLSNQCNLRCIMCYVKEYKWKYPVDRLEDIKIFYPYLEKMMWQGGEVFSLSYFVDLIKEAAKYPNLQQGIITNAQLLTKETIDLLVNMNLELTISVDGIKKDTYEYIRKNAKFEKLVQNLQYISEKKRKVNNINFIVGINFVVTKYNYKEILPLFNIIRRYGFDFFCIIPCGGYIVNEKKLYEYDNNYVTQEILEIEKRCKDSGIRLENRVTLLEKEMLKEVELEENTDEWLSKEDKIELENTEEIGVKEFVIIKDKRIGYSSEDIDINSYNKRKMICHIPWQQLTLDYNEIYFPDCQCNVSNNKNIVKFSDMTILDVWNSKELKQYRKMISVGKEKELCKPFCFDGKIQRNYFTTIVLMKYFYNIKEYDKVIELENVNELIKDLDINCNQTTNDELTIKLLAIIYLIKSHVYLKKNLDFEIDYILNRIASIKININSEYGVLLYFEIGKIYKEHQDYEKAKQIYKELLTTDVKEEQKKIEIMLSLADVYKDNKEYEKAEDIYKELLTLNIGDEQKKIEILFSLGCLFRDIAHALSEKQMFRYIKKSLKVFVDLFKKRHLIKNKDIKREFVKNFRDTCRDFRKLNKRI